MSQTKFEKAVEIVQSLPKDGPIKPTQDDQLYVSSHLPPRPFFDSMDLTPFLTVENSSTNTTSRVRRVTNWCRSRKLNDDP